MVMTSAQIAAELQRKRNLGIKPTDPSHMAAYNKLSAAPTQKVAPAMGQPVKPQQPISIGDGNAYVRKTLLDNGFNNDDINWDPNRKMVTLQGQDFLSPDKTVGGSSIASRDAIAGALSGFRDRQATTKTNELLGGLETAIKTPYTPPQFNYDPTSDPVYQAALRRAGANAETASGNAMAELNKRGILNSTITGDRLGQIQQAEYGRVSDEVLPQLFQQAYARHRDTVGDQYQQNRNSIGDLGSLLGTTNELGQQGRDNAYRDKTFDRGVLESDRGFNRGVLESDRGFNRGVLESDRSFNRGALESDRNYNLSNADNSRQNASAGFGRLMDVWSATGKAPAGLESYGVNPGDSYKPETAARVESQSAESMRTYFDTMAQRDDNGNLTNKDALRAAIVESPVSDYDAYQLFMRYNIPWDGPVPSPN